MEECFLTEYAFNLAILIGVFSVIFALFEIEIEGSLSWAATFPCFKWKKNKESKELTSYHMLLAALIFSFFELRNFASYGHLISLREILNILVWVLPAIALEDISWNFLNPSGRYSWQKTFVERRFPAIGNKFIWHLPIDYFLLTGISFILSIIVGIRIWVWVEVMMYVITIAIVVAVIVAPFLHKIFPDWEKRLDEYNRKHVFFYGDGVAVVSVKMPDGREYVTEVEGISIVGRINPKNEKEL